MPTSIKLPACSFATAPAKQNLRTALKLGSRSGLDWIFLTGLLFFSALSSAHCTINQMFGVNLSGAEFTPVAINPNASDFAYYHSKNLNLIRLPFLWESVQPTLNGPVNFTQLDAMVQLATNNGMKVILDVHNYGTYNGTPINVGSVSYAAFADLWTKLAAHYNGNTTVYGYGLMNEPGLSSAVWTTAAQNAINGIRTVDTTHAIYVAYWMGPSQNANTDPNNNLVYESHIYFDKNNSGTYAGSYDAEEATPMTGVLRADGFLNWCIKNQAKGFIGEFGIPNNDSRWNVVLDNFLQYLKTNGFSSTYWSGGHGWGSYPLSSDPVSGVDSTQMSVLKNYTTATYAGNYTGDVFNYTGSTNTGNLAIGKKAFSSSDFSPTEGRYAAIDGSLSTTWGAANGAPAFLGVDLGQPCNVNRFVVNHDPNHPSVDFKIQSSTDGLNFTDRVTVTSNGASVTTHPITTVNARYFRIYITNPGSDGITRVRDFEITGAGAGSGYVLSGQDLGTVGLAGNNSSTGGVYTVSGSGADIWGTADGFRFVSQQMTGNGTITARVTSQTNTDGWAKAGVMMRNALGTGDVHFGTFATPGSGMTSQWRTAASGNSGTGTAITGGAPYWVKIVRTGNVFAGSVSADGVTWVSTGSQTIAMNPTIYVGLAISSHNNSVLGTATFDNLLIQSSGQYILNGQDVGAVGVAGSNGSSGSVYTISGSGADIWGNADAFRYASQQMTGNGTITARVVSQTNTDGWAKAGVMMRNGLGAADVHACTLATPASGMTSQWRIASASNSGMGTQVTGTAPYWVRLTRTGNVFSGAVSPDGLTWTSTGSQTITMNATIYVGLAVSSHNNTVLGMAVFDNVIIGP